MTPKTQIIPPKPILLPLPEVVTCVRCNAHYPRSFAQVCLTCGGKLQYGLVVSTSFCYISGVPAGSVVEFARRALSGLRSPGGRFDYGRSRTQQEKAQGWQEAANGHSADGLECGRETR